MVLEGLVLGRTKGVRGWRWIEFVEEEEQEGSLKAARDGRSERIFWLGRLHQRRLKDAEGLLRCEVLEDLVGGCDEDEGRRSRRGKRTMGGKG